MASLEYDPSCNALYIRLKRGKVTQTEPVSDNVIFDLNDRNETLGIEILGPEPIDVSKFSHPIKVLSADRKSR